jgi:mannose/cellobiose epimerase-like protein (N-acyl-D-glucosamine 2-epimerase family)
MNKFWNPEYGIVNEYLQHDYSRIPDAASHMFAGHALEALWMVMHEALRVKDRALFDAAKSRIRRLLEMCWDYVFDGWGDGNFLVHDAPGRSRGPEYEIKTMWAHCEVLIACMTVLEYAGEVWAKEWYERTLAYLLKTMANTGHGVWRQAVDRLGRDIKRVGVSPKRKENFHQPRMLMMNLLSLQRLLDHAGRFTPFPR